MALVKVKLLFISLTILIFSCCIDDPQPVAKPLWILNSRSPILYMQDLNDITFAAKSPFQYMIIKKLTGTVDQQITLDSEGAGGAAIDGDRIYYGGNDNLFRCYDLNEQNIVWEFNTKTENESIPIVDERKVYWGSTDSTVYAVDKISGQLQWKYKTDCHIYSTPVLCDTILLIGSWDTRLYALNKYTGKNLWEFSAQSGIDQLPMVIGQSIWLPSYDGNIYEIDLFSGNMKNNIQGENAFEFSGARWRETLIFTGIDRSFYFVDMMNGNVDIKGMSPVAISATPVSYANYLITGQYDGSVYRWSLPSMEKELLYRFSDRVTFLLLDEEYLWAASWDMTLVCLKLISFPS